MSKEKNKRKVDDSAIADCTSAFKKMALSATTPKPVANHQTEPKSSKKRSKQKTRSWRQKTESQQVDDLKTKQTDSFTMNLRNQISAMLKIIRAETESEIQPAATQPSPTPSTSFVDVCLANSAEKKVSGKVERKPEYSPDEREVLEERILSTRIDGFGVEEKCTGKVDSATSVPSSPSASTGTLLSSSFDQKKAVSKSKRSTKSRLVDKQVLEGPSPPSETGKVRTMKQDSRKRRRRTGLDMFSKRTKASDDGMLERLVRLFAMLTL